MHSFAEVRMKLEGGLHKNEGARSDSGPHPRTGDAVRPSPGHTWPHLGAGPARASPSTFRRAPGGEQPPAAFLPGARRGAIPALKSVTGRPGARKRRASPSCSPRKSPTRPQPRHWERGRERGLGSLVPVGKAPPAAGRQNQHRQEPRGGSYHLSPTTSLAAAETAELGQRPGSARRTWKWRHGEARKAPPTNSSLTLHKLCEGRAELWREEGRGALGQVTVSSNSPGLLNRS